MAQTKAQLLGPVVGDVVMDVSTLSLDAEGNKVGIGTTGATATLHVFEPTEGDAVVQFNSGDNFPTVNRGLVIKSATGPTGYTGSKWIFDAQSSGGRLEFQTTSTPRLTILEGGDVQARRNRSNTAGDVALSIQPGDSTIHYGFRIDNANNNLNLDRVGAGNLTTFRNDGLIFAKALHITDNLTPTSGRGIEIFEAGTGVGQISSYNRDANGWDELRIKGSEIKIYTGTTNVLGLNLQSTQSTLYGTSDGILNLDSTNAGGSFMRFKQSGTTKCWVGSAEQMGGGTGADQDDLGLRAVGDIVFRANGAERLRITSAGLVGINNAAPTTVLDIKSTKNGDGLTVTKGSNVSAFLGHNGSGDEGLLLLKEGGATKVLLYAETNQNSYINSGGNFGIGTTTPSLSNGNGLHIAGSSAGIKLQNTNNTDWAFIEYADETNTTKFVQGYRDANGTYSIRPGASLNATPGITLISAGDVGIGTVSPTTKLDIYRSGSGAVLRFGKETIFGELQVDGQRIGIQGKRSSDNAVSGFFIENPSSTGTSNFELVTIKTAGTEKLRIESDGGTIIANAGTFPTTTNETLTIQGEGHNGHGTSNTRSVFNVTGAVTSNTSGAGLWIGARTNENTAVIGTRTASGNLAFETYNGGWGERMRLLNTGQLIVGGTANLAHPNMDDIIIGDANGNRGLTICSGTAAFGSVCFGDSADGSGNDRYEGYVEYYHNDNSLRLGTAHTEKVNITSTGDIRMGPSSFGTPKTKLDIIEDQSIPYGVTVAGSAAGFVGVMVRTRYYLEFSVEFYQHSTQTSIQLKFSRSSNAPSISIDYFSGGGYQIDHGVTGVAYISFLSANGNTLYTGTNHQSAYGAATPSWSHSGGTSDVLFKLSNIAYSNSSMCHFRINMPRGGINNVTVDRTYP